MPELFKPVSGVTGFFVFTREVWHRGRGRSTSTFLALLQIVLHLWRAPSWAEIEAAEKRQADEK